MKTNLFGKSNAVLIEEGNPTLDGIIGIITCKGGKNVDISKTLIRAIREHFAAPMDADIKLFDRISLTKPNQPVKTLTNQEKVSFSATWEEDGQELIRDFEIFITTTY